MENCLRARGYDGQPEKMHESPKHLIIEYVRAESLLFCCYESNLSSFPLTRLGLIAEHGFWVKPAAAHRKQQTRDRTSTGWDDTTDSGKPPDQFADMGEWGSERNGFGGRLRESRGSGASTPMGQQLPSMSYKHRGHRRVRTGSGGTLLSPDSFSKQQPADGAEWMMRSHNADLSWRSEVLAILQNFTGRTPGSFLELKDRYVCQSHGRFISYMQWRGSSLCRRGS